MKSKINLKMCDIGCPFMTDISLRKNGVACHNMEDELKNSAEYICYGTKLCGA